MTLEEQLALAILRGERYAAMALVDALQEEWARTETLDEQAKRERETMDGVHDSRHVYSWPEFHAFASRLGILWNLRTINLRITMNHGERVLIEQTYAPVDTLSAREVTSG